ncbi:MAG: family 43 glycosylhydrolase [Rheinheimera sp.]
MTMNFKAKTALAMLVVLGLAQAQATTTDNPAAGAAVSDGSFSNPLFPNGADPWLEYFDGNYYLTTTTWTSELVMRKSPTLAGLATATPINVWSATDPKRCCNFWAFEFHRLKGPNGYRWYMMYTAGQDGTLDHQHLNVLESAGDDPMGPYEYKGAMMPDVWNIDGNYLTFKDKLYLIYSQWQGDEQLNLIVPMDNPWTLTAGVKPMVLTRPELAWEISGRKVTEGAEVLQHQGRTFVTYSASFCDTPDYKLGLLELTGDDPMNPAHWQKSPEPVFSRTEQVFGPGHNGFFKSPDGKEHWLVYHGNDKPTDGCSATRSLRAQKFSFDQQGLPVFGKPLAPGVKVAAPSGEHTPLTTKVQGQRLQITDGQLCLIADAKGQVGKGSCALSGTAPDNANIWIADALATEGLRLNHPATGQFLTRTAKGYQLSPWQQKPEQQFYWSEGVLQPLLTAATKAASAKTIVTKTAGDPSADPAKPTCAKDDLHCQSWQLLPVGNTVLLSQQSGKAITVADCAKTSGARVQQDAWQGQLCQQWQFQQAADGFVSLKPAHAPELCLQVQDDAVVPGAALVQGSCQGKTALWRLLPVRGGGLVLENRHSKQVLDLSSCGLADGTALAQAPKLGHACQTFHLRAAKAF